MRVLRRWQWIPLAALCALLANATSRQTVAAVRNQDKQQEVHQEIGSQKGLWEDIPSAAITCRRPGWWMFSRENDLKDTMQQRLIIRPRIDPLGINPWKLTLLDVHYKKDSRFVSPPTIEQQRAIFSDSKKLEGIIIAHIYELHSVRNYTDTRTSLAGLTGVRSDMTADIDGEAYAVTRIVAQGNGHSFTVHAMTPVTNITTASPLFEEMFKSIGLATPKSSASSSKRSIRSSSAGTAASKGSIITVPAKTTSSSSRAKTPFEIFLQMQKLKLK